MQFLNGYKTYIGIIFTVLGAASGAFHWNLGDLAGVQDQVLTLVGSAIALYGYVNTKRGAK